MRNAFAAEMSEIARADERVVLMMGDIGNRLFNDYRAEFPERFFNCGIAEQNMITVAAGMALEGMRPVTYTIAPFITSRCLEQIRVDVCFHGLPVVIVGVGSGLCYAQLGSTHHAMEDVAIMRALPGMSVVCPGDAFEVRAALAAAVKNDGPTYIRIGKKNEPVVHAEVPEFEIGRAIELKSGKELCLLANGAILPEALAAAKRLEKKKISAGVASFHTAKPLDENYLSEVFGKYSLVATVEEHGEIGGFGGAVSEWLAGRKGVKAGFVKIAAPDKFILEAGDQAFARKLAGIDSESIFRKCLEAL